MSARKPSTGAEKAGQEEAAEAVATSAEEVGADAVATDPAAAPAQEAAPEVDKDAEIARLRAEAAESQAKLEGLLAGQSIGELATAEPLEGQAEVKMLVTISGLRNGEPWPVAGGTISVPAAEAAQLVANGYAVSVE